MYMLKKCIFSTTDIQLINNNNSCLDIVVGGCLLWFSHYNIISRFPYDLVLMKQSSKVFIVQAAQNMFKLVLFCSLRIITVYTHEV